MDFLFGFLVFIFDSLPIGTQDLLWLCAPAPNGAGVGVSVYICARIRTDVGTMPNKHLNLCTFSQGNSGLDLNTYIVLNTGWGYNKERKACSLLTKLNSILLCIYIGPLVLERSSLPSGS